MLAAREEFVRTEGFEGVEGVGDAGNAGSGRFRLYRSLLEQFEVPLGISAAVRQH